MYPYTMLVNREHPLAPSYVPGGLVCASFPFAAGTEEEKRRMEAAACTAAAELFCDCSAQGLSLIGISAYRSYSRQEILYKSCRDGSVAPPGCSEHQTGLALDVSCPAVGMKLTQDFASTPEGKWLARSAPLYGFIIRYPREKEKLTGYPWEPWHIRYVTKALSLYLSLTGLTLEEYYLL